MTGGTSSRIRRLPSEVVDRIAAGEVVERPASVVKELVENALDAGATRIDVEIRGGGRDAVIVRDDGCGMGPADLALAFVSHATSKLADVGDLDHIASFGFRGEALASVAAVADCRIVSRERGTENGHEIESRGGDVSEVRAAASPEGTVVDVRQLFKYVPARWKFLKGAAAESAHVTAAVQRAALANLGVAFSLTRDGETAFRVARGDGRAERIGRFFGRSLAAALVPVAGSDGATSLEGFVVRPDAARPSATWQHVFLNGRPIRDKTLLHALRQGYEGLLTRDRHPVAFLFLTMDPAEVDVNVHPAKTEVRFREGDRLHRLVHHAVRDALLATDLAPRIATRPVAASPDGALSPDAPQPTASAKERYLENVSDALADFVVSSRGKVAPPVRAYAGPPPLGAHAATRYLQVRDTYLVFETDDGIAIVDQHALHERVLLEQIHERVHAGRLEVQPLLVPAIVEVPSADVDLLLAHSDALDLAGVRVARFGETAVAVHALPAMLSHRDPARLVTGIVEHVREHEKAASAEDLLDTVLHSMACRGAVMAGDRLTEQQAAELLRRADLLDSAQGCAHGRPTSLRLSFRELERHFRR